MLVTELFQVNNIIVNTIILLEANTCRPYKPDSHLIKKPEEYIVLNGKKHGKLH